jgi:hypothetical protein
MTVPAYLLSLSDGLTLALTRSRTIAFRCANDSAELSSGSTRADFLLSLRDTLRRAKADFQEVGALDGISAYALEQIGYDIAPEFVILNGLIDDAVAEIESMFPVQNSGGTDYLLITYFDANGELTYRDVPPGGTVTLRGHLDAIVAQVETEAP